MKKKFLAIIGLVAMLSLSACGGQNSLQSASDNKPIVSTIDDDTSGEKSDISDNTATNAADSSDSSIVSEPSDTTDAPDAGELSPSASGNAPEAGDDTTSNTDNETTTIADENNIEDDNGNELLDYFIGNFNDGMYDELYIINTDNGTVSVSFVLFRLCSIDEGAGIFDDHKITFTATDPAGNPLKAEIYREADNSLTLCIVETTWTYFEAGETHPGFTK